MSLFQILEFIDITIQQKEGKGENKLKQKMLRKLDGIKELIIKLFNLESASNAAIPGLEKLPTKIKIKA